jgi:hypothetical protein
MLETRTPDDRREADCNRDWTCPLTFAVQRVFTYAQENGYTDPPNTPKLTCTWLQLVLVNMPKNLLAISGSISSSVGILQMARQATLQRYGFLPTYRPVIRNNKCFETSKIEYEQDSKLWL